MHDRGLLLVVLLGDIHKYSPVSELECIIAWNGGIVNRKVQKIHSDTEENMIVSLTHRK